MHDKFELPTLDSLESNQHFQQYVGLAEILFGMTTRQSDRTGVTHKLFGDIESNERQHRFKLTTADIGTHPSLGLKYTLIKPVVLRTVHFEAVASGESPSTKAAAANAPTLSPRLLRMQIEYEVKMRMRKGQSTKPPKGIEIRLYHATRNEDFVQALKARQPVAHDTAIATLLETYVAMTDVFLELDDRIEDTAGQRVVRKKWRTIFNKSLETTPHAVLSDFSLKEPDLTRPAGVDRFVSQFTPKTGGSVALFLDAAGITHEAEGKMALFAKLQDYCKKQGISDLLIFE